MTFYDADDARDSIDPEDGSEPCAPGEHSFARSSDTNEPIGRCLHCETTIEQAQSESEDDRG